MRIGSLRKRLALQSETLVADGNGGQVASWTTIGNVWAEIVSINDRQAVSVSGANGRITHKIILRHRADVKSGMRFVLGSRIFTIRKGSVDDEAGKWLEVMAEEGGLLG